MVLWSVHSCFQWCKNYKNGPQNVRVIVENIAVPFLWNTVYAFACFFAFGINCHNSHPYS